MGLGLPAALSPRRALHRPPPRPPGPSLRLLVGNVLWSNPTVDALVAAVRAAAAGSDLVALCEVTVAQARALDRALRWPGVVDGRDDSEGVAVWSRLALEGRARWFGAHRGIEADVVVGGTTVRLLLVHPEPPLPLAGRDWELDLAAIAAEAGEVGGPVVVCGDLNGTVWHRPVARFAAAGFADVHGSLGRSLSRSWPAGRRWPRLVRLDHALVRGLVPVAVRDVALPGSDHDGFLAELVLPAGAC